MTPDQQAALTLDHHVAVHANAGAGKTRVLVERFVAIVRSGRVESIEQIVATTFTVKAAAEMRSRIRARLEELGLTEWASNIASARITTLHSFCTSLLRKYSYASGIDVDAVELSQRRANAWRAEAMRTTIRRWLNETGLYGSERRERLLSVLDELDVYTTEGTISDLMHASERREQLAVMFSQSKAHVTHNWNTHVSNAARRLALKLMLHAQAELQRLQRDEGAQVQEIMERNDGLLESLRRAQTEDVLHVVRRMYKTLSTLYTDKGTARKTKMPFDACKLMSDLPKLEWQILPSYAEDTADEAFDRQYTLVQTCLELATEAAESYAEMKSERNAIDFDDMMNLTRRMLSRPDIATDVQRGIRFLMVDEFQDTSPVQYDIIRALVPQLEVSQRTDVPQTTISPEGPASYADVNLFIVGDAKQSIYGFRGADVRLFLQATRDIQKANRRAGKPDGRIVLAESFRMSPGLLPIVNGICEPVFAQNEDGIEYTPLTGGRQGAAAHATGTCTILRTKEERDEHYEMQHVAKQVVAMLEDDALRVADNVPTEDGGMSSIERRATPGDVAILVRTAAGVMEASVALRAASVPFQAHSGRAFFSRPEVADIRNLLRFSTDPDDDLAFAALVRSPLVLLFDADILTIAAMPHKGSLWQRMQALVQSGTASSEISQACARLLNWTTAVHVLAPSDFIQHVLTQSGWFSTLAHDPRREQILMNVEKVMELMLAEQETSNASLHDIIQTLTPPVADKEGDSPFTADPNSVQVMTLHAAKGLEFPIVVLANLGRRGHVPSTAWSDEIGLTFSSPEKVATFNKPSGEDVGADLLHTANKQLMKGATIDEDRRLMYVGVTRAKDHLVISLPEVGTVGIASLMEAAVSQLPCPVRHYDNVPSAPYNATVQLPAVIDLSAPMQAGHWLDLVTASDLLGHNAIAPEDTEPARHEGIRADHGPAYGTLMHDILQRIVTSVGSGATTDYLSIMDSVLSVRIASSEADVLARREITGVMESEFIKTHAHWFTGALVETTLLAPLDSTILQGMMDVRFQTDATTMEVWDWKTNVIRSASDIDALSEAYLPQARAYAWLCLTAFPHIEHVRTRLLFTKAAQSHNKTWVTMQEWKRSELHRLTTSIADAVHALVSRRSLYSQYF